MEIPDYTIANVVATCKLLPPTHISQEVLSSTAYSFFEYNPACFAASTAKLKEPRCTCLFFNTGSTVLTGAKSEEDARLASENFLIAVRNLLRMLYGGQIQEDAMPSIHEFTIVNIVAIAHCPDALKLVELYDDHSDVTTYSPERFPGLRYNYEKNPGVVFNCFRMGKVVIVGASRTDQLEAAWKDFYQNVLHDYLEERTHDQTSNEYLQEQRNDTQLVDDILQLFTEEVTSENG